MTIELNDEQCTAILTEGLSRGLYENNGAVPDDPQVRLKDATELVEAAERAYNNKNRSENVETIRFIAKCDQKPLALNPAEQKIAENVAAGNTLVYEKRESESTNIHNGLDLVSLSDGVIEGLIIGLDKYPPSEQVEADRKAFVGERERRKNAQAQKGQEVPQAEAPGEASQSPSQIADEGSGSLATVGGQASSKAGEDANTSDQIQTGNDGNGRADSAQGEDAGAFARAQTPETSEQGKQTKAKPAQEDGERAGLIEQITLPMIKAHGIDLTKIDSLTVDELKYIIDNPDGPTKEDKMPVNEREAEENAVRSNKEKSDAVSGIDLSKTSVERVVTKADLGLDAGEEEETHSDLSDDREKLESLVTGPMLKAYARGRKEIPSIGDNELRFMILNSDGKVTPEELEKARALDGIVPENTPQLEIEARVIAEAEAIKPKMEVTKEIPGPEQVSHFLEVDPEDQGKPEPGIESLMEKEVEETSPERRTERELESQQQNRAMEIISREGMPIPKDFDGQVPEFPNDISKVSDDELFSYHAIYHACESRANWVLLQYEEEVSDLAKLRSFREAKVAGDVPLISPEDNKRITNEHRDTIVANDHEVIELAKREHETSKIVKRWKVLRDNYRSDTSVCSRQWSMRSGELKDGPS